MGDTSSLKTLPLEELHIASGARFGGFAGWNMPLTYPLGVMKEHVHTREQAGLFDISHMKLIEVSGSDAAALFAKLCPIDVTKLNEGQSKYTFLMNNDAGIIDDLIVTRLGDERFMIVANAGNADIDIAHFQKGAAGLNCTVTPLDRILLAIQGPQAADVMKSLASDLGFSVEELKFMHGFEPKQGWFVTRSGYTGEDGFEIAAPLSDAQALAKSLLGDSRVAWIGLAARDSLRLEAGLCLHGQDITETIDPVSAGLTWAITKAVRETAAFPAAAKVLELIANGPEKRRVGIKPEGRQPVRAGTKLFDEAGSEVGEITSGGFGPSAGFPVAMGYVRADLKEPGTRLFAEVRGNKVPVDVHTLPFTQPRYHKG